MRKSSLDLDSVLLLIALILIGAIAWNLVTTTSQNHSNSYDKAKKLNQYYCISPVESEKAFLLSYYFFENDSIKLLDSGKNKLDLPVGFNFNFVSGLKNNSLEFNGLSDSLSLDSLFSYYRVNSFTLSFWFKQVSNSNNFLKINVFGSSFDGSATFTSFVKANTSVFLVNGSGNYSGIYNAFAQAVADNSWHSFILTSNEGVLNFYLDGTQFGSMNKKTNPTNVKVSLNFDSNKKTDFVVDELRLYSKSFENQDLIDREAFCKIDYAKLS